MRALSFDEVYKTAIKRFFQKSLFKSNFNIVELYTEVQEGAMIIRIKVEVEASSKSGFKQTRIQEHLNQITNMTDAANI